MQVTNESAKNLIEEAKMVASIIVDLESVKEDLASDPQTCKSLEICIAELHRAQDSLYTSLGKIVYMENLEAKWVKIL